MMNCIKKTWFHFHSPVCTVYTGSNAAGGSCCCLLLLVLLLILLYFTVFYFLWTIHNKIRFYNEELLASHPNPKVQDHPFSAVRDCTFNILPAILHIAGRSSFLKLRTRHAVLTGTALDVGCECMDWIHLAQDKAVFRAQLRFSLNEGNFLTI